MSRRGGCERIGHLRFPRVSGDEPDGTMLIQAVPMFSPRERG